MTHDYANQQPSPFACQKSSPCAAQQTSQNTGHYAGQSPASHSPKQVFALAMASSPAYSGFLGILISLCSLPFLALRTIVDFFAPPSAAEVLQRQRGTKHTSRPTGTLNADGQTEAREAFVASNASNAAGKVSAHAPHSLHATQAAHKASFSQPTQALSPPSAASNAAFNPVNTMKKEAKNGHPTTTYAKKTIKTGLSLQHGRIIISGRMADVCAELERLAALEAANA